MFENKNRRKIRFCYTTLQQKKVQVIVHKESMLIMHAIEKFEFKHVWSQPDCPHFIIPGFFLLLEKLSNLSY